MKALQLSRLRGGCYYRFPLYLHLKVCIKSEHLILLLRHNSRLLVFTNPLLEEIGLSLQGNLFHEIEGILRVPQFFAIQLDKEPIGHKLDVLLHEVAVHPKHCNGKCVC